MINENDELESIKLELSELKIKYENLKNDYDFIKAQNNNLKNDITVNCCMDNQR
jgi:hypothetical protein